jgi:hypothetical protein
MAAVPIADDVLIRRRPDRLAPRELPGSDVMAIGTGLGRVIGLAAVVWLGAAAVAATAATPDLFQQAVAYVFTGRVDPPDPVEIVDRKACIVIVADVRFKRLTRYYLAHFDMDHARFNTRYSGTRAYYELDVRGDDVILDYLDPTTRAVLQSYRSAQIALPGGLEQTRRALDVVFAASNCKASELKTPF